MRTEKEKFTFDFNNSFKFSGIIDETAKFIEDFQLLNRELWKRFVTQFRTDADNDALWRGEYWGKMMRGACFVYSYSKNAELYNILEETVTDMLNSADSFGRISTYGVEYEFDAWDLWCRKYVLLGMEYFLEICENSELADKIISSLSAQLDYIVSKIGDSESGKKPITSATRNWNGLNSSSILEPVVRLYKLTEKSEYLDFAKYIVSCGGTDIGNIFELAYEDKLYPFEYPVTKAYEMMSCFEGLLEYYEVTGEEKYKTAVINFADKILESDFTVIGTCGCTHELFDNSTVRQAYTTNGKIMQETCVTVTLMKFMFRLTLLTGDSKYVDAFEISLYNAYLGAVNTDRVVEKRIYEDERKLCIEPLPFDSYSPLTAGTRGNAIGGFNVMSDGHYYGCCACIGSAGIGLVPRMALLDFENGFAFNLYINGTVISKTPAGNTVKFITETEYPVLGKIKIAVQCDREEEFSVLLRIPTWSEKTVLKINGVYMPVEKGYTACTRIWKSGDEILLDLDMSTRVIHPIFPENAVCPCEDPLAKKHIALYRGPIVLAAENRLGYSVDEPADILYKSDRVDAVFPSEEIAPYKHIIEVTVPLKNGDRMHLTDYSSAGKTWSEESKTAAWILTV